MGVARHQANSSGRDETTAGRQGSSPGLLATVRQMAGALVNPTGVVGAALEATWIGLHLGLYPLDLRGSRAAGRRRGARSGHSRPDVRSLAVPEVDAAETPILLVHGLADNPSVFTVMRRGLTRRGFGPIETISYPILTGDIRVAAATLGAEVERIVGETGYERIHIIGHSVGGLIARYYVTRLGGDQRVHTVVTLGTPHAGSYLAFVWDNAVTRQLRPRSPLLTELAQPVRSCRTRFVAYWSDLDQVVLPQRHAALHHEDLNVHNIELHGVGHMCLPVTPSVVLGVCAALPRLDATGATVTPGVTELVCRRKTTTAPTATGLATAKPQVRAAPTR